MDAPVSQLSSPLLTSEGHTVELWMCQTVLLGVVGMREEEGCRETLLGGF